MAAKGTTTKGQEDMPADTPETFFIGSDGQKYQGKFNLNTCKVEHIQLLPFMTGTRGNLIINHRETRGNFMTMRQLEDITGIGKGLARELAQHCYVGDSDAPSELEKKIDSEMGDIK
jgi:DNA uptake protein ComE-like DNA-binding protein